MEGEGESFLGTDATVFQAEAELYATIMWTNHLIKLRDLKPGAYNCSDNQAALKTFNKLKQRNISKLVADSQGAENRRIASVDVLI